MTKRTGLEAAPKFARGSEAGNIRAIEHEMVLDLRAILGVANRQIDIGVCEACHGFDLFGGRSIGNDKGIPDNGKLLHTLK
jgi:hypothetical protein